MDNWLALFDGQTRYFLDIFDSPVKPDVLRFRGREALSEPFRWDIEFTTPQANIPPEQVLMKYATFRMRSGKSVHGRVTRLEWLSTSKDQSHYRLTLSSRLALLGYTRQCAVFQNQSVPEVVEQVLRRHGLEGPDFEFRLARTYPPREIITQWLGRQYYQYRTECMKYEKQRGDTLASAGASAGFAGITQEAKNRAGEYASELSVLQQHWGWLDDVKDAAIKMRNSMEQNPADRRREIVPEVYDSALRRAKRFLDYFHAANLGKPQPFPIDTAPPEMYAWFVHDLQTVDKGAGISQDFFVIRSMEMPEA